MKGYHLGEDFKIPDTLIISPIQTEEELNTLTKLYQQANHHTKFKNIFKWTKKTWKNCDNLVLKAELNDALIGAISIEIHKKEALIEDIAIRSDLQKSGIGMKLWEYSEHQLKLRGVNIIKGQIHYKRAEIIPFCYKNGFRLNKVVQDGFGKKEDFIEVIKYI
ncbi:MAG: GNAT family N-acetyltransferase [Candidatus Heimdallarchaeota archaeon]